MTFPQLLAHYRAADLFVSLSEHEGFCVPLVEAMHFGVPDRRLRLDGGARDGGRRHAAAPREGSALAWPWPPSGCCTDDALRKTMIEAGHRRVEHFSLENNRRRLLEALEPRIIAHG